MRRRSLLASLLLAAPLFGCGTGYELPTERPRGGVPTDKSYGMIATWTNMTDVQDVLLTQGSGTQLFILFNHGDGGGGPDVPRGEVQLYPLSRSEPIGAIERADDEAGTYHRPSTGIVLRDFLLGFDLQCAVIF